ncbi:hypothetical protein HYO99_gp76 [Roseobacter phage RD-1410W1-01]|uniref:Uncharacterized protein n=1 Tax=Roseobacter phage RD-1410W1-01 TaxID=1815984 RepID=A0A191VYM2_9CAUD|nr:hypothetical protein HYO99_gp76 [Roseobacter phage RD-1410W1-01]ANJ20810.1 hypothetical protein RDp01_gp76 [Roseobacter phage RD-1410W1-01]
MSNQPHREKYIRAEKTTRNRDDYKVLIVGLICAIFIMLAMTTLPRFAEQRWYRDLARLTPFYGVELLYSNVSEDTISVSVGGSLVKRRCEFNTLFGYIYGDNNIRYRVPVDTSSEPEGNRPPSDTPESWGPWTLSMNDNPNIPVTVVPIRWEIIAEHINCPTEPVTQRNLFIGGEWVDFAFVVDEELPLEVTTGDE